VDKGAGVDGEQLEWSVAASNQQSMFCRGGRVALSGLSEFFIRILPSCFASFSDSLAARKFQHSKQPLDSLLDRTKRGKRFFRSESRSESSSTTSPPPKVSDIRFRVFACSALMDARTSTTHLVVNRPLPRSAGDFALLWLESSVALQHHRMRLEEARPKARSVNVEAHIWH
jgi:hypothetical protein